MPPPIKNMKISGMIESINSKQLMNYWLQKKIHSGIIINDSSNRTGSFPMV